MFGHVKINREDLSEAAFVRYRAVYCGLCHTLGERCGAYARLLLTYDLTFLAVLLSAMYEPEEKASEHRCCVHPIKKQHTVQSAAVDYAADMTVALCYHKALDDVQDDKNPVGFALSRLLKKHYAEVKERWPQQCACMEKELAALAKLERARSTDADAAAKCFGRLMARLFVFREDHFSEELAQMGYALGRFIYLADAAIDRKKDERRHRYNPLSELDPNPETLRPILMTVLGGASTAFERLPIVEDAELIRNILYSGIWMKYNRACGKAAEETA